MTSRARGEIREELRDLGDSDFLVARTEVHVHTRRLLQSIF